MLFTFVFNPLHIISILNIKLNLHCIESKRFKVLKYGHNLKHLINIFKIISQDKYRSSSSTFVKRSKELNIFLESLLNFSKENKEIYLKFDF